MSATPPASAEILAAAMFALALAHTFSTRQFERLSARFPRHAGLFHLLGEVEVVFGFWAILFVAALAAQDGSALALDYVESRTYTEPLFVFVVMTVAASQPILAAVRHTLARLAGLLPLPRPLAAAWLGLALVPLLGSLITEPAAMTIAALMLAPQIFRPEMPEPSKYLALGALFVNVSIGGTLTAYAAPPVLMVANAWEWTSAFMLAAFGWKAALAVLFNATLATAVLYRPLLAAPPAAEDDGDNGIPPAIILIHLACLAGVVLFAHHPVVFLGIFLLFLGFCQAYEHYQSPLILKEALLVAFFLAGLVVLGGMQAWWLSPLLSDMSPGVLLFGATALTAVADNAALTYLGSLIPDISDAAKYSLVSGAVAGGGLSVIANAPNPAGAALLKNGFADRSIGAVGLFLGALLPTAAALAAFSFL